MPTTKHMCCSMREFFLVGIVGQNQGMSAPIELADFVIQWEPKIIVAIKFCPFCGTKLDDTQVVRSIG